MSRYLEFDSSFRNRNQFPNPSSFTIDISQSGQKNKNNAVDPVCDSSPIYVWNATFDELSATNVLANITLSPTSLPTTAGTTTFLITISAGHAFRQVNGFYNGSVIETTISGVTYVRRITDYQFLNTLNAIITLDNPLPDGCVNNSTAIITNQTPLPTNSANSVIKFFIPGGSAIDNFYEGYYIECYLDNSSIPSFEYQLITAYDGATRLATLASATTTDWSTLYNGIFCIRKQIPNDIGAIKNIYNNAINLSFTSSSENGSYVGNFLRISAPIVFPTISTLVNDPLIDQERRIIKYVTGNGAFINIPTGFTVYLVDPSNTDFTGCFITGNSGSVYRISSYDVSTHQATLATSWVSTDTSWMIRTAFIDTTFATSPANYRYEIEPFTRDNCNPFNYTGSVVSSTEMVCYEVELLNLVLPNILLKSGRGGRAIFYPYMYVELRQISSSSAGNKGIIYSNNPNSTKMLFRALMDDTTQPVISPFIKIGSDGMSHSIKFNPNDSFHFSVYHANGELFQTVANDFYSPTEPNPLVQISACFSFKRV